MAALKAILAFVALIIIVVIVWYFTYGFKGTHILPTSSTTTVPSNTINSTTSSTTSIYLSGPCQLYALLTSKPNNTQITECAYGGGTLGMWVESGNTKSEHVTIVGLDNKTYVNQSSTYQCLTFYKNYTLPAQTYKITLTSGTPVQNTSTSCVYAGVILNTTTSPYKSTVYQYVYNGNYSNGAYTGWNVTGKGFGPAPLNISYANYNPTSRCYVGSPWMGYIGNFIATTYNCGTAPAPGNITSSTFLAYKNFLNFKIISPQQNLFYVEILYNNTPYVIVHYNTFNITQGSNAPSTFRNASIPLVTVANKPVQVRVVADTLNAQTFIAVGDFTMANSPHQDPGIQYGPYNFTH